ncbi:MAG: 16S rRNA (cytosine(1402)-N(4))-methyltransferase RsmH [Halofilum sp. (in: g-proteobacteria)]|nr:16S rRNA (cytosine(1402)-N(4))-methyltransferase RsmH [Halofilum sp. (in: g-proteobacteria)]
MDNATVHRPVLLEEALAALNVQEDGAYVDATYGRGGHAAALVERLGPRGSLLAIDRDPQAVAAAREHLGDDARVHVVQGDFAMLADIARHYRPARGYDGILMDLGVSSPQLDDPARGFSFRHGGPLDMRMDPGAGPSAAEWLAEVDERELADVIRRLGEERHAKRIARAIVREREREPITTTDRLADIVARAVPGRERERHPATRTFQAIRMHINAELESLDAALAAAPELLASGGRLAVISFHSLEDRRVKQFMRRCADTGSGAQRDERGRPLPVVRSVTPVLRLVGKGQAPSDAEIEFNPRARSARLRVAEKLA